MLKTIKTPEYPTNYLFFDTETRPKKIGGKYNAERHYFWFGCSIAYRLEGSERTRVKEKTHKTVDDFWQFVVDRLDKRRPLWAFAHNIIFDLTILDAWTKGDQFGFNVDLPVLDDPPVFICCSHDRGKVNFIDTFNYWKASVDDIGKQQGKPKLSMPDCKCLCKDWIEYCKRDSEVLSVAVDNLVEWLKANRLGPLTYTIASVAMSTYRHRFMPKDTIHVHNNEEILQLERESYHGGLTHAYFIGEIKRKCYMLDVNSLYPAMMLKRYPTRIQGTTNNTTPRELKKVMERFGGLALVHIKTKDHPYPLYRHKRLIEAIGEYNTVLCGQELIDALNQGHVKEVKYTVTYQLDDIFSKYVNYFHNKRVEYKKAGDEIGSLFAKYLMNSLYGKFGQRGIEWIDLNYDLLDKLYIQQGLQIPKMYEDEKNLPVFGFGVNYWTPEGFNDPLTLRYVGKCLQVKLTNGEHHESCPIIAAYVTSYARSYVRFLRGIAGATHVFYTDTDSLFCDEVAYKRLGDSGYIDSNVLGKLKEEDTTNYLRIYGPKDYVWGKQKVIKGIRHNAKPVCSICFATLDLRQRCLQCGHRATEVNSFRQLQFEGIKSILRREPEPFVEIKEVVKTLSREYKKGTVSKSGWTEYQVVMDY